MTEVSRAEKLAYGDFAAVIRRLGSAATNVTQARDEIVDALASLHQADEIQGGLVSDRPQGPSEMTMWMETVYNRVYELERLATAVYRDLGIEVATRERDQRQGIDSLPALDVTREVKRGVSVEPSAGVR